LDISGNTKVCALIGDPVEHSLSPSIHNAAFQHLNLNYVYLAFRVGRKELGAAIQGVRSLKIHGLNVTMPLKTDVIQHLDQLDESARRVGAVNTVLNDSGELIGYNTDGIGALMALRASQQDPTNKRIVVLGAGGASRAISCSLIKEAREVVILNRTLEKAENLTKELSVVFVEKVKYGKLCKSCLRRELKDADMLINATSVGMQPDEEKTPVDRDLLRPDLTVFDVVYSPLETRLLKEARLIGAKTINGLSMLIHQGAASFEIWTGEKAPVEVMMRAAREKLEVSNLGSVV